MSVNRGAALPHPLGAAFLRGHQDRVVQVSKPVAAANSGGTTAQHAVIDHGHATAAGVPTLPRRQDDDLVLLVRLRQPRRDGPGPQEAKKLIASDRALGFERG